jgi:hypothetical protein
MQKYAIIHLRRIIRHRKNSFSCGMGIYAYQSSPYASLLCPDSGALEIVSQ